MNFYGERVNKLYVPKQRCGRHYEDKVDEFGIPRGGFRDYKTGRRLQPWELKTKMAIKPKKVVISVRRKMLEDFKKENPLIHVNDELLGCKTCKGCTPETRDWLKLNAFCKKRGQWVGRHCRCKAYNGLKRIKGANDTKLR